MKQFKMSITNGSVYAPAMIVEANNEIEAEKLARSKSGLGAYKSWNFYAVMLVIK